MPTATKSVKKSKAVKKTKIAPKRKELSVFQKNQKIIAFQTLRMSDAGAMVMGGMSKDEARKFLLKIGYTEKEIAKIEESANSANDVSALSKIILVEIEDIVEKSVRSSVRRDMINTGKFQRENGGSVRINTVTPYINVKLAEDGEEHFYQGDEAKKLLDNIPENVGDDDYIFWRTLNAKNT